MVFSKLSAGIAALFAAQSALATSIMYPLYVYPGDNCADWATILPVTAQYPKVTFYFIVNPDSGPGSAATPDSNYAACIPKLRTTANPNVILLGYVDTAEAGRSSTAVAAEVTKYANWPTAYHLDGIFFDDVIATSSHESYYSTITANVKTHSIFKTVTLNPGAVPNSGYYAFADLIVSAETYYSDFSISQLTISSNAPAAQQVVILHDGPTTPPASLISSLSAKGIKAVYITDITQAEGAYDYTMDNYSAFVADVNATV